MKEDTILGVTIDFILSVAALILIKICLGLGYNHFAVYRPLLTLFLRFGCRIIKL